MGKRDKWKAVTVAKGVRERYFPAGLPPAKHFAEGIASMGGRLSFLGDCRRDQPTLVSDGDGGFVLTLPCDGVRCLPRAVMGGARMLGYLFMDILDDADIRSLEGKKVSMILPDDLPSGDDPMSMAIRRSVVFASELLLPERLVRDAMSVETEETVWERCGLFWLRRLPVRKTKRVRRSVEDMADSLGVSAVSAHIRIYGLGMTKEYMALPAW